MPPPPTGYQPLPPAYGINPPSMMAPNMPSAFDSGSNLASMGMSAGGTTPQNLHNPNPISLSSASGDSAGQQAQQPGVAQVNAIARLQILRQLLLSVALNYLKYLCRVLRFPSSTRWTCPSNVILSSCEPQSEKSSAIR